MRRSTKKHALPHLLSSDSLCIVDCRPDAARQPNFAATHRGPTQGSRNSQNRIERHYRHGLGRALTRESHDAQCLRDEQRVQHGNWGRALVGRVLACFFRSNQGNRRWRDVHDRGHVFRRDNAGRLCVGIRVATVRR